MITVIGSINLDLIATVETLPNPGETIPGQTFTTAPGGKGANQALAAARAGGKVGMIGAVGKDSFAREARALLTGAGIDMSGIREAHNSTGVALIFVDGRGENVIVIVAGANGTVLPGDLAKAVLSKGDVVLLQQEIPLDTVDAALDASRKAGAVSILNTAPYRDDAAHLAQKAAIVVSNETEFDRLALALKLNGGERKSRMLELAASSGSTVIVTLGAEGVLAAHDGQILEVPALPVEPIDTVGAGDTFCGYLAAALSGGRPLDVALRRAAAAASLACTKAGAQPAIPLAAQVDAALKTIEPASAAS